MDIGFGFIQFIASHKMRSYATILNSKIFPFTPRPFACKGGGVGGGVVKQKFPQKYLPSCYS